MDANTPSILLYALIVSCEVAFWVVLLSSLSVRYLWRRDVLSRWLLLALPLVDVLLLLFTALDLGAGTPATFAHGLAAVYVGYTVAFGSTLIRWADDHFAFRFAGGPAPAKAPTRGWAVVRYDLGLWLRCIGAWVLALGLIEALIAYVGNDEATAPLLDWYRHGFGTIVIWLVFGPLWSLLFFRRAGAEG